MDDGVWFYEAAWLLSMRSSRGGSVVTSMQQRCIDLPIQFQLLVAVGIVLFRPDAEGILRVDAVTDLADSIRLVRDLGRR